MNRKIIIKRASQVTGKDDKITPKDIHNLVWKCRNFEIDNLWKRSTLLATFLVLFWTGLGYTFYKYIDLRMDNEKVFRLASSIGNFFLIGIQIYCVLGSFISMLWIAMTKGSKAWVEYFESQINTMCGEDDFREMIFSKEVEKGLKKDHFPYHGYTPDCICAEWKNSIISSDGGAFSPSRINIVIGIVSFLLFSMLEYFLFVGILLNAVSFNIVIGSGVIVLSYFVCNYLIYKSVKSDFLQGMV